MEGKEGLGKWGSGETRTPGAGVWQVFPETGKMLAEANKGVLFPAARSWTIALTFRDVTNHDDLATRPPFSMQIYSPEKHRTSQPW